MRTVSGSVLMGCGKSWGWDTVEGLASKSSSQLSYLNSVDMSLNNADRFILPDRYSMQRKYLTIKPPKLSIKNLNHLQIIRDSRTDQERKPSICEAEKENKERKATFIEAVKNKDYLKAIPEKGGSVMKTDKSISISKRGIRNFYLMENQDVIFVEEKECSQFYGVYDGHGKYGRMMAETACEKISQKFQAQMRKSSYKISENIYEETLFNVLYETNQYLCSTYPKESEHSGTTALIIFITQEEFYCFNVGSSRAVLAKTGKQGKLQAFPISSDHNLARFDERNRIVSTGAVLEQHRDENDCRLGPQRIWKKGQRYPGTFITRSLGMNLSNSLGIICKPEYVKLRRRQNFKFILAGSDGFWDVFSNSEAIKFLQSYWENKCLQKGMNMLFEEASKRWQNKSDLMDDISVLLIRL